MTSRAATDIFSIRDGSWFVPSNTWSPATLPTFGDNVTIRHNVSFNSGDSSQSVAVGNLNLVGGILSVSGPATLESAGSHSVVSGDNLFGGVLFNRGVFYHGPSAVVGMPYGNTRFENLGSGIYEIQGDGGFYCSGGGGSPPIFRNYGWLRKNAGISGFTNVAFNNQGGTVEVAGGTLGLSGGGASSNGTLVVAAGAVLDLTGGTSPTWAGWVGGSGAGTVSLNSGTLKAGGLTLDLPGSLFQWTGGTLAGTVTNHNTITVAGSGSVVMSGFLFNRGSICHTNSSELGMPCGSRLENLASGIYDLSGDGSFYCSGGGGVLPCFRNVGLLRKSAGVSGFTNVTFSNEGGTVQVNGGTLCLSGGGTSSDGTLVVAAGAVLDLTGGSSPTWAGWVGGSGAGTVSLNSGTLGASALTLDLPGSLFQWTGGTLSGTVTNHNTITVAGSGSVGMRGVLYNRGLMRHTGSASLGMPCGSHLENLASGTYELAGNGGIYWSGGGGILPYFSNYGLLRKNGGASGFTNVTLSNQGGTIEVDAGTLYLSGGGSSSNGTLVVAAGAVLDWTGGSSPTWAGRVGGSGAGTVSLNGGVLAASGLSLDLPGSLFQWTGGSIEGTATNRNTITVAGTGSVGVRGVLFNQGLIRHTGGARLGMPCGTHLENLASGTYEFAGDGNIYCNGGGGTLPYFNNYGLLRKSGGTGVSDFTDTTYSGKGGAVEVDSGTLQVGVYAQGGGALTIALGGADSGQSGRLSVSGGATLDGPLNVILTNRFSPSVGQTFQILSCGSRSGVFAATNIPAGLSLSYTSRGAFLTVTSPVGRTLMDPALSGTNLTFSFQTEPGATYTVLFNDDLKTTNWQFLRTVSGDGAIQACVIPMTNTAQRFFRVRQP